MNRHELLRERAVQVGTIDNWTDYIVKWRIDKGFKTDWGNLTEKIMLVVTELGRAVDADREDKDELVIHELTDALVRLLDLMGSIKIHVHNSLVEVMDGNEGRPRKHGKKY